MKKQYLVAIIVVITMLSSLTQLNTKDQTKDNKEEEKLKLELENTKNTDKAETNINKNEPTYDNPPDWIPTEEEIEESKEGLADKYIKSQEKKTKPKHLEETNEEGMKVEYQNEDEYLTDEEYDIKMKNEEEEFANKIANDMGIYSMKVVTKEVFREYMSRVILTTTEEDNIEEGEVEEDPEEEEFLNMLIEEIMKEIPDSFPVEEFKSYSDTDKYKHLVDKIMKDKFGDNYGEDVLKMLSGSFDTAKEGMPNIEDLEEMMKEFKTSQGDNETDKESNKKKKTNNNNNNKKKKNFEDLDMESLKDLLGGMEGDDNTEGLSESDKIKKQLETLKKLQEMNLDLGGEDTKDNDNMDINDLLKESGLSDEDLQNLINKKDVDDESTGNSGDKVDKNVNDIDLDDDKNENIDLEQDL